MERLHRRLQQSGPMSVTEYMTLSLLDAKDGYYPSRDPIGAGADFITAPEISQIFGELVGVWLASVWQQMGEPKDINLLELGPGKGTMMSDILRTARALPAFAQALQVHLHEASAALIAVQAQTLAPYPASINWCDGVSDSGKGPLLLVANEYLDCLPVAQWVRKGAHWLPRQVRLDAAGKLAFTLGAIPATDEQITGSALATILPKEGDLVECRPGLAGLMQALSNRAGQAPVMALFVDYGAAKTEPGDSLQAIGRHQKVDPLTRPGEVDITTQVNFAELALMAKQHGLAVSTPVTQRNWLLQMGLLERASVLSAKDTASRNIIARQVNRLIDASEMGELFKFMAVYSNHLHLPPGFEEGA